MIQQLLEDSLSVIPLGTENDECQGVDEKFNLKFIAAFNCDNWSLEDSTVDVGKTDDRPR